MRTAQGVPRGAAVQVLTAVLSDGTPLDLALDRVSRQKGLETVARAWLTDVTAGVLRWKGRLDLAIDSTALKKKPTGWLRKILLVAAYQLIVQERVAAAVVVSESVSETKSREGEFPAKFVNATLRKIASTARQWRELPFPASGSSAEKAGWASMPEWMWNRIVAQQGESWARDFAEASFERPRLWLCLAPGAVATEAGISGPVERSFSPAEGGAIADREGFIEGNFFVQDISSQLLVSEIAKGVKLGIHSEHPSALDLCAAPGGKAMGLAWNGFHVEATDIDLSRISLIEENILRLKSSDVHVLPRDEVAGLPPQDLVWVDAPCTGSGIIRRHPDIRWIRRETDLHALTERQLQLVREAWERVRAGGYLAYSVCSIFVDEGQEILERAGLGAKIQKCWALSPQQAPNGDGFWAALLRKS